MIAYVKDDELHILGFSNGEIKQLTFGARESRKVSPYKYVYSEKVGRYLLTNMYILNRTILFER
jgi:dipeptidyl-peptidase-4